MCVHSKKCARFNKTHEIRIKHGCDLYNMRADKKMHVHLKKIKINTSMSHSMLCSYALLESVFYNPGGFWCPCSDHLAHGWPSCHMVKLCQQIKSASDSSGLHDRWSPLHDHNMQTNLTTAVKPLSSGHVEENWSCLFTCHSIWCCPVSSVIDRRPSHEQHTHTDVRMISTLPMRAQPSCWHTHTHTLTRMLCFLGGIWEVPALPQHPPASSPRPTWPTTEPKQAFLLTNDLWMCLPACLSVLMSVIVYKKYLSLASMWSFSMSNYCCLLYSFEIFVVFNRTSVFNPFLYNLFVFIWGDFLNALSKYCILAPVSVFCYSTWVYICVWSWGHVIEYSFQCVRAHMCWCMTV